MKQLLSYIIYMMLIAFISSCSATVHSGSAKTRNLTGSAIAETGNIADLKVGAEKVAGTSNENNVSEEIAKNLAVYDALKKANADVLVEPSYEIDRKGNNISVTVSGYPGFYKNFRKPTDKDSLIIGWKLNPNNTKVNSNTSGDLILKGSNLLYNQK